MDNFRIEKDTMGEIQVPAWAYWGAQTQRAVENFAVSGLRMPPMMIAALGLVKRCAAQVNGDLGLLEPRLAEVIAQAAEEVADGKWNEHFPVDVFQTGSGTSTNMNANEVIANRANELLGSPLGSKKPVHPNDHVNLGQSSNDVFPTAIHIAVRQQLDLLIERLRRLQASLARKSEEFKDVLKIGRTHLQDAVPMTLGQEFSGYASQVKHAIRRIERTFADLEELALGGTAVGTGLNTHPEFASRVIEKIREQTGIPFKEASNRFEAMANRDALVELMGTLNSLAVSLMRIANDLRLLSSGPRTGFGEITVPALQPGSSMMPGKVNPVILEMVMQVAAQVMGCHLAVTVGGQNAPLELNIMMPMMAHDVLFSIEILTRAISSLDEKCIAGIEAKAEKCEEWIEKSLALVTPLSRRIGYDKAAQIAQRAYREKKTIREVVLEEKLLSEKEADDILNPRHMLGPDIFSPLP
ncbi:MAG: class II fumarate hydratase [Calditrichaeota bacterium]|nr:class II fumarate hydratase [Calditrichota bacterium]